MKVRLLKKARKRFDIIHMPEGFTYSGSVYDYNLFKLVDDTNQFFEVYTQLGTKPNSVAQFCGESRIFETEAECINYLKDVILHRLRSEGHRGTKDDKRKRKHRKVWHVQA
jgi:hypothetical protein